MHLSYDRDKLMKFRGTMPASLIPDILDSADVTANSAARVHQRSRPRGGRAGSLQVEEAGPPSCSPCSLPFQRALSLSNKSDELNLPLWKKNDFNRNAAFVFHETWLKADISDSAVELPGYHFIRADSDQSLSGKSSGGGLCCYTNSNWCTDVSVIHKHCWVLQSHC
jgi:hypothetical protein